LSLFPQSSSAKYASSRSRRLHFAHGSLKDLLFIQPSEMHYLNQISVLTFLLALAPLSQAKQALLSQTGEIYYLTNCFNGMSRASYAEIDYYSNKTLSAIDGKSSQPTLLAFVNTSSSIDYEDGMWSSLAGCPFNFTVVIGNGAYTASAGTVVGSANSSTSASTMECVRLARVVVHVQKEVTCYSDYACIDSAN
jgi:hypothetical protein